MQDYDIYSKKMLKEYDSLKNTVIQTDYVNSCFEIAKSYSITDFIKVKSSMCSIITTSDKLETQTKNKLSKLRKKIGNSTVNIDKNLFKVRKENDSKVYEKQLDALIYAESCMDIYNSIKECNDGVYEQRVLLNGILKELFNKTDDPENEHDSISNNANITDNLPENEPEWKKWSIPICSNLCVQANVKRLKTEYDLKSKCEQIKKECGDIPNSRKPYFDKMSIAKAVGTFFAIMTVCGIFSILCQNTLGIVLTVLLPPIIITSIYVVYIYCDYKSRYKKWKNYPKLIEAMNKLADKLTAEIMNIFHNKTNTDVIYNKIYDELVSPLYEQCMEAKRRLQEVSISLNKMTSEAATLFNGATDFLPEKFNKSYLPKIIRLMQEEPILDFQSALKRVEDR